MPDIYGVRRAMYVVTGASLLVPIVGIVTAPVLAQALGVAGRGEFATAIAPNSLVVSIATLGLPEALTYELARRPKLTRRALVFSGVVSVLVGALCLATAALSASLLTAGDPRLADLLLLATALAIPALVVNLLRGAAAGRQQWGAIGAERVINAVLRLVLICGLAAAGQLTVTTALLVVAVSPIIAGAAYWRLLFERGARLGSADITDVQVPVGRPLMTFGTRIWLGAVASMLYGRISQLVITPLSDVRQLGLFVVAITISDVPLLLANAVRDVVFGVNAREADIHQLTLASRLTTLVGFTGAAALGAILPWAITPLFGHEFAEALVPTWLLLAAAVIGMPGLIASAGLAAWGRPGLRSSVVVVGLVVNTVGLVALVPSGGAVGAAIAGMVSAATTSVLAVAAMSRIARVRPFSFVVIRRADVALLAREALAAVRRVRPRRFHRTPL